MSTIHREVRTKLGKRLQASRTDRPDEWNMDEYTRMAEEQGDLIEELYWGLINVSSKFHIATEDQDSVFNVDHILEDVDNLLAKVEKSYD